MKSIKILLGILIFSYASLYFCQNYSFHIADLGRHIINGKFFFENLEILRTNFYSQDYAKFPVLNHHYGSGIIFYFLDQWLGLNGLSVVYSALLILSLLIFLLIEKFSFFSMLILVFIMPFLGGHSTPRPEAFSFLFLGLTSLLIHFYAQQKISFKLLSIFLGLLQILFVNIHIFFCFEVLIVFFYGIHLYVNHREDYKKFLILSLILIFVSLINPFGIHGALAPLFIFKNYGYMLYENQSIFFLHSLGVIEGYYHFLIVIFLIGLILLLSLRKKEYFYHLLVLGFFFILGLKVQRAVILMAFMSLVHLPPLLKDLNFKFRNLSLSIFALILICLFSNGYKMNQEVLGFGPNEGYDRLGAFLTNTPIKGPIFNNYDIGSYLVYYLFPRERVFVENRPEAYPEDFFQNIYIPMQEKEDMWRLQLLRKNFNAIVFSYRDYTPWAKTFLKNRLADSEWIPVFADEVSVVFLKNTTENLPIIQTYGIPKNRFEF